MATLKGTRFVDVSAAEVGSAGLVGDRLFCLVDPGGVGVLRTIRHPALMGVVAAWDGVRLSLSTPTGRKVVAPPEPTGKRLTVDYWGRATTVEIMAGPHAGVLAPLVGRQVLLARAAPGDVVYGGAVSLLATGELAELSQRLGHDVDPRRFRGNVLLDVERPPAPGTRLPLGTATLEVLGPIPRCGVIDRHPDSGSAAPGPLIELARYRRAGDAIDFGVDARVVTPGHVRL